MSEKRLGRLEELARLAHERFEQIQQRCIEQDAELLVLRTAFLASLKPTRYGDLRAGIRIALEDAHSAHPPTGPDDRVGIAAQNALRALLKQIE